MNAPSTVFPYLSRVRGRNVKEKLHKNVGHAKNAINGTRGPGQIFEWVDGEWKLLYDETGYPYSWQVAGIAKKKEDTKKNIQDNRNRALETYRREASDLLERGVFVPESRDSFEEGYVAAKIAIWDAQSEYMKRSRF